MSDNDPKRKYANSIIDSNQIMKSPACYLEAKEILEKAGEGSFMHNTMHRCKIRALIGAALIIISFLLFHFFWLYDLADDLVAYTCCAISILILLCGLFNPLFMPLVVHSIVLHRIKTGKYFIELSIDKTIETAAGHVEEQNEYLRKQEEKKKQQQKKQL